MICFLSFGCLKGFYLFHNGVEKQCLGTFNTNYIICENDENFKLPFSKEQNFCERKLKNIFEIFKDIQIWTFCLLPVFGLSVLCLPLHQWFSKLAQNAPQESFISIVGVIYKLRKVSLRCLLKDLCLVLRVPYGLCFVPGKLTVTQGIAFWTL